MDDALHDVPTDSQLKMLAKRLLWLRDYAGDTVEITSERFGRRLEVRCYRLDGGPAGGYSIPGSDDAPLWWWQRELEKRRIALV